MHNPTVSIKRFVLCCGLSLALLPASYGSNDNDTSRLAPTPCDSTESAPSKPLMLYFRIGKATVESGYSNNRHTLHHLRTILADSALCSRIDSLHILSFASPDGKLAYNLQLATQRSVTVREYLLSNYPHLAPHRIHARPQGENWKELRQLISLDDSLPARDEALSIIDRIADNERCKLLLKKLDQGRAYRYIARHILPQLRNASVCMVYLRKPLPPIDENTEKGAALLHATHGYTPPTAEGTLAYQPTTYLLKRPLLALKTNLLFDLALAPNIEVEVPIGNRWSVNAEWMFPWWLFDNDKYCFRVLSGGVEGRYWLGNRTKRRVLTGHFAGLYAGGGKYDLQWDRNGYQGTFYIAAGASYGYALPIGRNLSLEFSIGLGLLRTDYEFYHTLDNYRTLLWQNSGRYSWLGPTKAKISFVWMLNRHAKIQKGGVK